MAIFVGSFTVLNVSAITYPITAEVSSTKGKAEIWTCAGTKNHETTENKGKSEKKCELPNGTQLMVLGEERDGDKDLWYKVNYGDNFQETGYAYSGRVKLNLEFKYDSDFEENLKNFPESYHSALRVLHERFPNWRFVANNLDITFKEAVESEYGVNSVSGTRKWVEFSFGGNEWRDMRAYNSSTNEWIKLETRWTYASRVAIEYYMDPRNSLNEDMIFAFMQQSYQEDENMSENLLKVIKGTFLEQGYDGNKDAYINDIINAAKTSGVSPYVLAATIIVEQGTRGGTNLISGTYPGFEGYYNFFNYSTTGANADEMAVSGLTYAKTNGWNSRTAAIVGGAKNYADGYISLGQDTYYYKDFNVILKNWSHQYASALYDAWTNAKYLKKGCVANADATFTFSIPVFKDMPQSACHYPTANDITEITPTPPPTPTPAPTPTVKKGDTSGDGKINAVDLAAVKMDILGVKKLSGTAFTAGDVNGDNVINAIDLAAIKMHILGVKSLS